MAETSLAFNRAALSNLSPADLGEEHRSTYPS
jgi:hypothetical protein